MVGYHNYQLAQHGEAVGYSQLSKSERDIIHTMARCGTKPKDILKQLQIEDPNCAVSLKIIYNQVQIAKQNLLKGPSVNQEKPKEEQKIKKRKD